MAGSGQVAGLGRGGSSVVAMRAPWAQGWTSPTGDMLGHQTRSPWRALSSKILKGWAREGKANSFRKHVFPEAMVTWGCRAGTSRSGRRGAGNDSPASYRDVG